MIESQHNHSSESDRLTSIFLKVIGVYCILFVLLLNIFILDKGKLKIKDIIGPEMPPIQSHDGHNHEGDDHTGHGHTH